jgi:putative protein kinase ArgK-like GTPase of G3E family
LNFYLEINNLYFIFTKIHPKNHFFIISRLLSSIISSSRVLNYGVYFKVLINKKFNKVVMKINIAIDGPAGSGKSSLSQALAQKLNYRFLDSGLFYRYFAKACAENGIN